MTDTASECEVNKDIALWVIQATLGVKLLRSVPRMGCVSPKPTMQDAIRKAAELRRSCCACSVLRSSAPSAVYRVFWG